MKASGKKRAIVATQAAQLAALVILCWGVASMAGRGESWVEELDPKAVGGLVAFIAFTWLTARLERKP